MKEKLGGSVPSCWDIFCIGRPWPDLPGEAKVANFDVIVVEENILRFEVAMEVPIFVQIGQSSGNFEEDGFNLMFC